MSKLYFVLAFLTVFSPIVLADQTQDPPFAVVELFSSEGCSSCPSADLLVSKLIRWAKQNNQHVYALIFHVDYWNSLGWRDVFSRKEFTRRQNTYAHIFKDQGMYTPQMIVNGSDAFIGSDQQQLQQDLDRELTMPANVKLSISLDNTEDNVIVKYNAQGFSQGDVLNVALVERGLTTAVTEGENTGRTLHHDNIVREFETIPLTQNASQVTISLRRVLDMSQSSVIAYVQNPQTMLIEAAQQQDFENDPT